MSSSEIQVCKDCAHWEGYTRAQMREIEDALGMCPFEGTCKFVKNGSSNAWCYKWEKKNEVPTFRS